MTRSLFVLFLLEHRYNFFSMVSVSRLPLPCDFFRSNWQFFYGFNSEMLTVLKEIFPDTQKFIDTVKYFKYEVPTSILPPFPDIHMIFNILRMPVIIIWICAISQLMWNQKFLILFSSYMTQILIPQNIQRVSNILFWWRKSDIII